MHLTRKNLEEIKEAQQPVIGFWGAPPVEALESVSKKHPGISFFDLDVYYNAPASRLLPDAYCHIIRNCVDNAISLGSLLTVVVAACGQEKCDAGRFAATLLKEISDAEIIITTNETSGTLSAPLLCESGGSLKKRTIRIMESIIEPLSEQERTTAFITRCEPTCGFWGTPPHPIEVLDLFPKTTHIFGWTRCVEQARPADLELEMQVPDNLPIVFFSQGFCAKSMLARHLAEKYRGMHVDVHDLLGAATTAKIEAFIRLSGGGR